MKQRTCTNHCRTCGGHFTSLAAFDAHREHFKCTWPEDAPLVEIEHGVCTIGDPELPQAAVRLYEHADAQVAREYFAGRQTGCKERKRDAAGARAA
jgi:hypothetical protein